MSEEHLAIIIIFGIAIVISGVAVAWLYWRLALRRVAGVVVGRDRGIEIVARAPSARAYTVYLRFKISYQGNKGHYGLVCYLEGEADGENVLNEVVSAGYDTEHVKEMPIRFTGTEYFASTSRRGSQYERSATVKLAELQHVRKGALIAVRGRIVEAPDTHVESLEVFIA